MEWGIAEHIIQYLSVSLCERSIAESSHITILSPRGHVSSARELLIVPQDFLQQLWSVHTYLV